MIFIFFALFPFYTLSSVGDTTYAWGALTTVRRAFSMKYNLFLFLFINRKPLAFRFRSRFVSVLRLRRQYSYVSRVQTSRRHSSQSPTGLFCAGTMLRENSKNDSNRFVNYVLL